MVRRFSKHKMTTYAEFFGGMAPPWQRLWCLNTIWCLLCVNTLQHVNTLAQPRYPLDRNWTFDLLCNTNMSLAQFYRLLSTSRRPTHRCVRQDRITIAVVFVSKRPTQRAPAACVKRGRARLTRGKSMARSIRSRRSCQLLHSDRMQPLKAGRCCADKSRGARW